MSDPSEVNYDDEPVVGLSVEYESGFVHPTHSHDRAQLLFASSGIMVTEIPGASYVIPPGRALWIPSEVPHTVACRSAVSLRTLYIKPGSIKQAMDCKILDVSDFLQALILEAVDFATNRDDRERQDRIVQLLISEIVAMPTAPFQIRMPSDKRLLAICQELQASPADKKDLGGWADFAGMSKRSLTRLFRKQTGMGLSAWRQQARLLEGLSLLASGHAVTDVSYVVGYDSPSAFSAVFRKTFGVSPSQYRQR